MAEYHSSDGANREVWRAEARHNVRYGIGAGIEPQLHLAFEERFGFPLHSDIRSTPRAGREPATARQWWKARNRPLKAAGVTGFVCTRGEPVEAPRWLLVLLNGSAKNNKDASFAKFDRQ